MKNLKKSLRIEKFFREQLWQILIVILFACICAWIFDKWFEAILFCISHTIIRYSFEKQYHCESTCLCLILTLTILFFGIAYCLPISISLLFTIPLCFFISWVGYISQDRIECHKIIKNLKNKTIWEMDESELADYCYAKGIRGDMLEFVVMVVAQQMKYADISVKLGYAIDTLKDWSPKCKKLLEITSWKHQ